MAYKHFSVGPIPGLNLAELSDVPDLLVIVGPNGAGKSRLLDNLWTNRIQYSEPGTRVSYVGPNRPWRRMTLSAVSVLGMQHTYSSVIQLDGVPGFQYGQPAGFNYSGLPRRADSADDAQSLVKVAIIRIEVKRQRIITAAFDAYKSNAGFPDVPDLFDPFRRMISTLLPHLRFDRVDVSIENNQQCIFKKLDMIEPTDVELDDLSSGEKAIIALFLPFIEGQIESIQSQFDTRLARIQAGLIGQEVSNEAEVSATPVKPPMPTILIDEPELHLHPALQVTLMTYVRELIRAREAQFIMTTHSTVLMDTLEEDELYILIPPTMALGGNQLSKLTGTAEKLELIRQLTGSAYVVTRCRPIVFLEGDAPDRAKLSDQRVIETLIPEVKGWVLVPARGRREAIAAASTLRDPSLTELPGLPVFALVDQDQSSLSAGDHIVTWPVTMMENLLLDPVAIWSLIEPFKERVGLHSLADVETALRGYCTARHAEEVRLRMAPRVAKPSISMSLEKLEDVDNLETAAAAEMAAYVAKAGGADKLKEKLQMAIAAAEAEVDGIEKGQRELQEFHGKAIFNRFYQDYGTKTQMAHQTFAYLLAQKVAGTTRVLNLVSKPILKITQYVPASLVFFTEQAIGLLADTPIHPEALEAHHTLSGERAAWEAGISGVGDRVKLRQQIIRIGRALKEGGHEESSKRLLAELVQLAVAS